MKKTHSFLLAVACAAMVFTFFACSGDDSSDNGGGSSNLSDLPTQVYLVDYVDNELKRGAEYEGNGDIYLTEGDTILIGKIQNGQILLDLPQLDSKYLRSLNDEAEEGSCQGVSVVPRNVAYFTPQSYLYAIIPGKSYCRILPYLIKSGKTIDGSYAQFYYFSESGKITGTATCTYDDGETGQAKYNANFSKGWNFVYLYFDYLDLDYDYVTTDLPSDTTLELWLRCWD